ncbi:hypothetical protein [Halocalculus aciditolerans]|uniref:Uncharacterized protein n=1 Tax=Halocalculus aciditolerans TaxID=1383812 RepID=A0A830FJS2_9EURY|nr:hypothetical protein [Halocalculus aciditolerans]GGL59413.1 hypothetical protein GCM10009039_17060 [Halocalculus aciditolerans]
MSRALRALAVVALLVLAGCSGGSTTMTPDDPQTTQSTTTTTPANPQTTTTTDGTQTTTGLGDGGYYRAYTVRASPASLDDAAADVARTPDDLARHRAEEARLVRRAAANGSASRVKMGPDVNLGLDGELVAVNGTYARVNATVTTRESVTAHLVHADGPLENSYEGDELDAYRERAVNDSALSRADRRAVAATIGISSGPYDGYHGIGYWHYFRNGTVPENATLADGDTHVVRYDGTLWKFELDPSRTSEQVRYRVTYTLDTVASNESAWEAYVREHHVTALENAPVGPADRDVLRRAIENGTVEWEGTTENEPAGFEALAAEHPRYVERNGTLYRVTVEEVVE